MQQRLGTCSTLRNAIYAIYCLWTMHLSSNFPTIYIENQCKNKTKKILLFCICRVFVCISWIPVQHFWLAMFLMCYIKSGQDFIKALKKTKKNSFRLNALLFGPQKWSPGAAKKKADATADSFLCIELVNLIQGASFKLLT